MKVQGLVALITGGASGFGKGFASALLHKGARGVSLVDISDGKNIVDEFSDKFGSDRVLYHEADVTSDTDMENAFANTVEHFTGLDVVCNNAGILDESKWKKVVDVNLMPGGDKAFDVNNIRINMVCPTFADTSLLRTFASQLSPDEYEEFKESVGVVPVSDVVAAYMRLVEEDLHGEAIRISIEKGIDLHKFRKQPKLHLSKF